MYISAFDVERKESSPEVEFKIEVSRRLWLSCFPLNRLSPCSLVTFVLFHTAAGAKWASALNCQRFRDIVGHLQPPRRP